MAEKINNHYYLLFSRIKPNFRSSRKSKVQFIWKYVLTKSKIHCLCLVVHGPCTIVTTLENISAVFLHPSIAPGARCTEIVQTSLFVSKSSCTWPSCEFYFSSSTIGFRFLNGILCLVNCDCKFFYKPASRPMAVALCNEFKGKLSFDKIKAAIENNHNFINYYH